MNEDETSIIEWKNELIKVTSNILRLEKLPLEIIKCGKSTVNISRLLKILHEKGIKKILLEGGGTINWSFLKYGLVDEMIVTISTYVLGGRNSISLVEGNGFKNLQVSTKLKLEKVQKVDDELIIQYKI